MKLDKIFLSFLLIFSFALFTGCSDDGNDNKPKNDSANNNTDDNNDSKDNKNTSSASVSLSGAISGKVVSDRKPQVNKYSVDPGLKISWRDSNRNSVTIIVAHKGGKVIEGRYSIQDEDSPETDVMYSSANLTYDDKWSSEGGGFVEITENSDDRVIGTIHNIALENWNPRKDESAYLSNGEFNVAK
jgi:hypothetical protein